MLKSDPGNASLCAQRLRGHTLLSRAGSAGPRPPRKRPGKETRRSPEPKCGLFSSYPPLSPLPRQSAPRGPFRSTVHGRARAGRALQRKVRRTVEGAGLKDTSMCREHARRVSHTQVPRGLLTQAQEMPDLQLRPLRRETGEQQAEHVEGDQPQEPRLGPVCLLWDTSRDTQQRQLLQGQASCLQGQGESGGRGGPSLRPQDTGEWVRAAAGGGWGEPGCPHGNRCPGTEGQSLAWGWGAQHLAPWTGASACWAESVFGLSRS